MPAAGSAISIDALHQEFDVLKVAERERQGFVDKLLTLVQELTVECEDKTRSLRAREMLVNTYQDRFENAEQKLDDLQRAVDCNKFVLVLVDGDDTLFKDDYIKDGLRGGERAARDLKQALSDHFKTKQYFKPDHRIVVRIYLNLIGLSKTYTNATISFSPDSFQYFVQGFNKTSQLIEMIDAGNGKDGADDMIKAEFNLFEKNVQCTQIVLAGSGDNGYGGLLRSCAPSCGKSEKVTLIEALPFVQEQRYLTDKFEHVRFENVFRNTKIDAAALPFHDRIKTSWVQPSSRTALSKSPPSSTPGLVNNSSANLASGPNENGSRADSGKRDPRSYQYYVNQLGQRVDISIRGLDEELVQKFKRRKLCNSHYLEQGCPYDKTGKTCLHDHSPQLSRNELEYLRYVARLKPCDYGFDCSFALCSKGHRCQSGTQCWHWEKKQCHFSDAMHRVDTDNLKVVTESGR